MELASGMGLPPPWGVIEDYHFFFKNSTGGRFANRPYTNQIQPEPGIKGGRRTRAGENKRIIIRRHSCQRKYHNVNIILTNISSFGMINDDKYDAANDQ
jgi:hypothetical protein